MKKTRHSTFFRANEFRADDPHSFKYALKTVTTKEFKEKRKLISTEIRLLRTKKFRLFSVL